MKKTVTISCFLLLLYGFGHRVEASYDNGGSLDYVRNSQSFGIHDMVAPEALTLNGYFALKEQTSDDAPLGGYGNLYAKDDGLYYYNGSLAFLLTNGNLGAESIAANSLDFSEFKDAMTLDATTTIAMGVSDLNFDSNTLVIDSTANGVGIGTASPGDSVISGASASSTLEISASTDPSLQIRNVDDSYGFDLWTDTSAGIAYLDSRRDSAVDSSGFRFRTRTDGTADTVMSITGNGNVGINNTSPDAYLQVEADNEEDTIAIFSADGATGVKINDAGAGTNHWFGQIEFVGNTSISGRRGIAGEILGTSGRDEYHADSAVLMFNSTFAGAALENANLFSWQEAGTVHMIMDPSGNVGISTATPSTELEVSGTITGTQFNGSGAGLTDIPAEAISNGSLDWDDFKDAMTLDATTTIAMGANDLNFDDDAFVIDSSTNGIGLGTSSPSKRLDVRGDVSIGRRLYMNNGATQMIYFAGYSGGGMDNSLIIGTGGANMRSVDTLTGEHNTFVGMDAGDDMVEGYNNTAIGALALANTINGNYNVAVGSNALNQNTSGSSNVAAGQSLQSNTTGSNNVAIGYAALENNVSGGTNVAIGRDAMEENIDGDYNIGIGPFAAHSNNGGGYNIAIGYSAGSANTDGNSNISIGNSANYVNKMSSNIAIGNSAASSSTNGTANTAIGIQALRYNVLGSYNTALGYQAGEGTSTKSHSNSTFIGYQTGLAVTNGDNNTMLGYKAGDNVNSGSSNIIIGASVDAPVADADSQLNIGNTIYADMLNDQVSIGTTTNLAILTLEGGMAMDEISAPSATTGYGQLYVGTDSNLYFLSDTGATTMLSNGSSGSGVSALDDLSDAKVGVTVNDPLYLGTGAGDGDSSTSSSENVGVGYNTLYSSGAGDVRNTAIGYSALYTNNGDDNVALGYYSLNSNTTGYRNTAVGRSSSYKNTTGNYNSSLGYQALNENTSGATGQKHEYLKQMTIHA